MIVILRVPAAITQEGNEEWQDPSETFQNTEVCGPFVDRADAANFATMFDDGTWLWRIVDTEKNKSSEKIHEEYGKPPYDDAE